MAHSSSPAPRARVHPVTLVLLALLTVAALWLALLDWRGGNSSGVPFVPQETVQ